MWLECLNDAFHALSIFAGICCEHIDYACEDDSNKIIDCNKQLDKCQMNKWFDVLARFCAGSCG